MRAKAANKRAPFWGGRLCLPRRSVGDFVRQSHTVTAHRCALGTRWATPRAFRELALAFAAIFFFLCGTIASVEGSKSETSTPSPEVGGH